MVLPCIIEMHSETRLKNLLESSAGFYNFL